MYRLTACYGQPADPAAFATGGVTVFTQRLDDLLSA